MARTEEFTVQWDDPREAELSWRIDRVHSPEPMTPIGGSGMGRGVTHGFAVAFAHYSVPARLRYKIVNHWVYASQAPLDVPREEAERMMAETEAKMGEALAGLGELWDDRYLPEIKSLLGPLQSFDVESASEEELLAHWERTLEALDRLWEIHFLIVIPAYLAVSEFDELYRSVFEPTDVHASYRLLQGLGNKTVDTGIALWELSRRVKDLPEVELVLTQAPDNANVLTRVEEVDGGQAFIADLRAYLDEYGQRGDKWDIGFPSWTEDPSPVLKNLREYLGRETHPAVELQRQAAERERLITEAREKLDGEQRKAFDFLLRAAEKGLVITEDHGFWIDYRGMHQLRRAAVELGRRFAAAGVVDKPEDVVFLELDEITETARALPALDRRGLVEERRASYERARAMTPPPFIGAPPPEEDGPPNPIQRSMMKMFGGPPPEQLIAGELHGHPGSPGVVRGRARVIMSITDADRLEPGEILVAPTTAPPWTPLFAVAGGIVTDTGGILSHCAVVAREYQIPAVVGCGNATQQIRDGQTIELDGTEGVVRLVD